MSLQRETNSAEAENSHEADCGANDFGGQADHCWGWVRGWGEAGGHGGDGAGLRARPWGVEHISVEMDDGGTMSVSVEELLCIRKAALLGNVFGGFT
jgi:hypothetical protein